MSNDNIFNTDKERRNIRLPLTLYVDAIEINPSVEFGEVTRTTYDLEFTEYDLRKLHEEIGRYLDKPLPGGKRIRFIGRLVS